MTHLPFPRAYWVEPGRFLAGFLPGDLKTAQARLNLTALADCGITKVVNLMEEDERDHSGRPFVDYFPILQDIARQRGVTLDMIRRPIPDLGVPPVYEMVDTLDLLDSAWRAGCVYLHCWGGRGRTGTVVGCWRARHGIASGEGVLQRLKLLTAHNPLDFRRIPETTIQSEYVRNWQAEA